MKELTTHLKAWLAEQGKRAARRFPFGTLFGCLWPAVLVILLWPPALLAQGQPDDWRVAVSGNQAKTTAELLESAHEELDAFAARGHAASAVDDAAFVMETVYRRDGYADALVEYELNQSARQVLFRIQEGKQTVLTDIAIAGNDSIPRARLLALDPAIDRAIKDRRQFPYVSDAISSLADSIRSLYLAEGYLQVQVDAGTPASAGVEGKGAIVRINVAEGRRFSLEEITVSGDVPEDLREPVAGIAEAMRGMVYQGRLKLVLKTKLRDLYANAGYADVSVSVKEVGEEQSGKMRLAATVKSGRQVAVQGVRISGNDRTSADFIRSRLKFAPGSLYRLDDKREGFSKLYETGLFSNVDLDLADGPAPGQRTVEVAVEERKSRELYLEPGWGSYELLRLKSGYKDGNLFGTGRILRVDTAFSTMGRSLEVGVSDPWFLGTDITLGVPFHYRFRTEPAFTMESSGADVILGKIYHKNVTINAGYQYSRDLVSDIRPNVDLAGLPSNYNTAAISFQLTRDTRDDLFYPSRGYRGNVALAMARPDFGGTIAYNRMTTGVRYFYPLSASSTIGVRFNTGVILPAAGEDSIPVGERFFNGGENSVRSFQASKLGPVDANGEPLGGTAFSIYVLEWRKKLTEDFGWSIFWDLGNISPNRTTVNGQSPLAADAATLIRATWNDYFSDFRSGIGTGLQYMLPVGPARLDLAFNPSPDEARHEDDYVLHFSIGMAF